MNRTKVRRLTMAALMGAIAFILMYLNFGVPFLSPFAEFDLSALPEMIGGFILGPAGAVEIIAVKILLILVFKGTSSMFTGEVQNFLLSLAYVLPAVLYYRKNRTKKGAAIGLVLGSVLSVIVAIFTNLYLIFPAYIYLYGMSWDSIIEICSAANPWITDIPTFAAFSVVPFNVISRAVTSVITMLVYKKISVPLKKLIQ
ncbi:MAG: ECF transporter S component [Clostridiales bacterium]|nr:ECF transporter S component [Clostridiales bacterium]MDY5348185.1 ECF transporter S component [Candidatus Ventricola sp.]MDY5515646.1 ECF transporter S component [Candidatus Ventricola sp.]